ncbi:MAG: Ig-like domain-containing protein, partial [Chloroflexota bacterium]
MSKISRRFSLLVSLLGLLVITACNGAGSVEPEPTESVPTPELPTWTPRPTTEPAPTAEPTAIPTLDTEAINQEFDWEPQPILFSPAPGEESLLDGSITIRFDQPMDEASVEEAFNIEPAVDGQFSWPRPDLVIFTPSNQLERLQQYNVQLADSAKGQNGKTLREPVKFQVQTIGALEVSSVIPADGTTDVPTDGALTVLFNRPVVPLVATQDQDSLPFPIELEPPTPGKGEWISTSIFRFVPDSGFAGATNYRVTVLEGLTDVTGATLDTSLRSSFSTITPRVESLFPYEGYNSWPLDKELEITFNMPMDPAQTEQAIRLNPASPLIFDWSSNNRQVTITPSELLQVETSYQLIIDQSAAPTSGQGGLDQTYTVNFSTVPLPEVVWTEPAHRDRSAPPYGYINVEFSAPMDWSTLEETIIIDPEPSKVRLNYREGSNWLGISFNMRPSTQYEITLPGTAADPYGNALGRDYVFNFTTAESDPFIQLNVPFSINVFSTSFAPQIDVRYLNVSQLDLQLNRLDGYRQELFYGGFWASQPEGAEFRQWTQPVEDIQNEDGIVRLDLNDGQPLPTGIYHLLINAPNLLYQERDRFADNRVLVVADTNLVIKETVDGVYVWATNISSGQPAAGLDVTLFGDRGQEIGTGLTDGNGLAFFPEAAPTDRYFNGVIAVSGTEGEAGFGIAGSQWNQTISPWEFGVNWDSSQEDPNKSYLYTDRPIYRPGDVVQFRGIWRSQDYGRYTVSDDRPIVVELFEQAYFGPQEPYQDDLVIQSGPNGIFFGEFKLPEEAVPGNYSITASGQSGTGFSQVNIQIAEFRKPEFEVSVIADESDVLRGEDATVTLQADYFFGGSASDLEVNYTVYDQTFDFRYPEPYRFNTLDYFFWIPFEPSPNQPVFSGSGTTDANGQLVIELPADILEDAEAGSRNITIEATVFDVNFQPFSASTNMTFHASEVYVGVQTTDYVATAGEPAAFSILTVDWDGETVGDVPIEATLYRRDWERNDDGWYEPVDTAVEGTSVQFMTDREGRSNLEYVINDGGSYKVEVVSTDPGGRAHMSSVLFWVSGDNARWRNQPESKTMQLIPDKAEYSVGETARLLVQSPFEGEQKAWLTIERGKIIEQRMININGTGDTIEVPITLDHMPNIHVTLTTIKPENSGESQYADMRFGVINLPVDIDPLLLNVERTPRLPESGLFGPGETAVFDVQITNQNGQPVAGTMSLALVDNAIFALA